MAETTRSLFHDRLALHARRVEETMTELLEPAPGEDEIARPKRLVKAMRHAVLNGGKRLRPFFVIEAARLFSDDRDAGGAALRVAAALECVHCYSLVHDDLPAMDDDDMRRGKPTVHVAFDEATAILAGDALLTLAFDVICAPDLPLGDDRKLVLARALARAAGLGGMVGGQMLDLESERAPADDAGIVTLQAMKTGGLIRFACEAGAIVGGAAPADRKRLRRFGEIVGLAFQLADDLLDVTADPAALGKATGKDAARGKGTLVALHGAHWGRVRLIELVDEADTLLAPFGERGAVLSQAARFVAERGH